MPLYRTVSDRGLWKKYQKEQVQHFHKPQYLDKGDKPLVSESDNDIHEGLKLDSNSASGN
jgi:hypothetical protein